MDIEIDYVLSVSSEDESSPASNLTMGRRWTVAEKGISEAIVDLKFKKSSIINSISIGNHECAMIMVEVGSSALSNDWFSFLPSTRFMDQSESRNGTNTTRVKLFSITDFHAENSKKSWDKVRITCQQLFNSRQRKIGLSFITFGSGESRTKSNEKVKNKIAAKESEMIEKLKKTDITIKDVYNSNEYSIEAKKSDIEKALEDQKKAKDEKIRREKEIIQKNKFDSNDFIKKDVKPKHRPEENQSLKHKIDNCSLNNPLNYNTLYKNDGTPSKNGGQSQSKENSFNKRKRNIEEEKEAAKKRKIEQKAAENILDSKSDRPKITKKDRQKDVPFNKILENVRIALSGFVNPERSRIRDQAIEMGAKFDRDLTPMTTHLVCAFENTPKAKKFDYGIIVKKTWIHLQHATKKRIDWKKHSFMKQDSDESEDEDLYFRQKNESETDRKPVQNQPVQPQPDEIDTDDEINEVLDQKTKSDPPETDKVDQDEVVERIIRDTPKSQTGQNKSNKVSRKGFIEYSYNKDEDYCLSDYSDENEKPKLYLFAPYIFYVSEKIENFDSISTVILKNGGCIDDAIDHTTTHVIQCKTKKKKKNIIYVRPEWILDSFKHKKLLNPHIPRYTPESI